MRGRGEWGLQPLHLSVGPSKGRLRTAAATSAARMYAVVPDGSGRLEPKVPLAEVPSLPRLRTPGSTIAAAEPRPTTIASTASTEPLSVAPPSAFASAPASLTASAATAPAAPTARNAPPTPTAATWFATSAALAAAMEGDRKTCEARGKGCREGRPKGCEGISAESAAAAATTTTSSSARNADGPIIAARALGLDHRGGGCARGRGLPRNAGLRVVWVVHLPLLEPAETPEESEAAAGWQKRTEAALRG